MTKAEERAKADMDLCPECHQGPVRPMSPHEDGRHQAVCEKHGSPLFLERHSGAEPWRKTEPDPGAG